MPLRHDGCVKQKDAAAGLVRLDALIAADLFSRVDGMNRAAVIGWGTMFNVVHLVGAVRVLHAQGRCHAAVPLLRSVMEYTLGTMWLADAGDDAADVFNRKLQGAQRKLHGSLGGIDLDERFPPGAVQIFRDTLAADLPAHPDERLTAFTHLLKEYGFEQMIAVYNVLSGITHLSLEGAQAFFEDREGAIRLSQQPLRGELLPCEQICLGMQFDAMNAYNDLLDGKPWTVELGRIAAEHGLSTRLASRTVKQA